MFLNKWIISIIIIIVLNNKLVNGYSLGGPTRACVHLIPGHGTDKQITSPPYQLIIKSNINSVLVSIVAKDSYFTGFMIQGRSVDNRNKIIDGYFSEDKQSQIKSCNSDKANTLTHRSGSQKTRIDSEWIPPNDHFSQTIIFRATIVQNKQIFWTEIDSNSIQFINGKIVLVENNDKKFMSGLEENDRNEENIENSINLKSDSQKSDQILNYSKCSQKSCLGNNNNCIEDKTCQYLISGSISNGTKNTRNIDFELNAITSPSKWYSMAFSEDNKMGSDSSIDCFITSDGKVKIGLSFNSGKTNQLIKEQNIIKQISNNYLNGIISCKWTFIETKFNLKGKEFDLLEKKYYILLAHGDLDSDDGIKNYHLQKLSSNKPINLEQKGIIVSKDNSNLTFLVRIHGSFMIISWIGLISIAILLARHYKQVWVSNTLCGVKIWFAFHRGLMIISLILMFLAQISIFYYLDFNYQFGTHQIFGSLAFIIAILQPIGALFRPSPDSSNRWIFNWIHWLGGNIGHIMASIAILLSTYLKLADLPHPFFWICISFLIFHVFIHIILQFHSFFMQNRKTHDIALQDMNNSTENDYQIERDSPGTGFKRFILGVYIVIVFSFVSLLIIYISVPKKTLEKMALI